MQFATTMLLISLPLLFGCAYEDSHIARKAETDLVGMSVSDLDMCAGLPTKTERINPATELRSYERNEATNSGINLTFPVIGGGMNIGNGGYCHATFKLINGQVTDVRYAGDTTVAGAKSAVCAPIVRTCLEQHDHGAPSGGEAVSSWQ